MRALGVICLLAACGNDTGLLLDVDPASQDVATVEVFLPKDTAGDGIGLPPNGAMKQDGPIYEVVDSIAAELDASGRVRVLLQPGDLSDVPALLVLGYDANHTPIASAVVTDPSGAIHLPRFTGVQLKVTLVASSYGPPAAAAGASGVRIARWSATGPGGDLDGPCIAVIGPDGNSFFTSADGDLDCDAAAPDCDDTRYRFTEPSTGPPPNPICVSQSDAPATKDACIVGQTVSCSDGVGTCGPRNGNNAEVPLCVPATVCKNCPNSDDDATMSGIDPACENATRMDPNTLRVDCKLVVTQPMQGVYLPCPSPTNTPAAVDLSRFVGQGWTCAAPVGFLNAYGGMFMPGPVRVGGLPTAPDYTISAHCATGPGVNLSYDLAPGGANGPVTSNVAAVLVTGMRQTTTAPASILGLPFLLTYTPNDLCPPQPLTCQVVQPSGDPKDDPMWKCAGGI